MRGCLSSSVHACVCVCVCARTRTCVCMCVCVVGKKAKVIPMSSPASVFSARLHLITTNFQCHGDPAVKGSLRNGWVTAMKKQLL